MKKRITNKLLFEILEKNNELLDTVGYHILKAPIYKKMMAGNKLKLGFAGESESIGIKANSIIVEVLSKKYKEAKKYEDKRYCLIYDGISVELNLKVRKII